ncbi:hypothetical protein BLX24_27495 [Arsenicibacter rosenii]|uniref:Outer membrane protein beta-barrel domain-containing protein n=1 Tax=Arsenicibacter rosenii TaxID=1750698 RepID=A0A1S2VD97_9BACT|nr:hypothetical protein BLX24_27495 [Arsenicibacter rosenii]
MSGSLVVAQTTPAKKTTTTTTKPTSATSTKPAGSVTKPASTAPAAAPATTTTSGEPSENRLQKMYDEYHGVNQSKPGSTATTPAKTGTTGKPAGRPAATTPAPAPAPTAVAMSDDEAGFHIGFRAGASYLLPLESVDGAKLGSEVGYVGGLVLNFGRGIFSFQPEINYSQQKIKATATGTNLDLSVTGIENRIEVPLLLKFSFGDPAATRFFVNVGPYGAYALSGRTKGSILGVPYDEKVTFNGSEGRISYGAAGGLGVALPLGPGHLTVEARALYHIGDNSPKATTPTSPTEDPSTIKRALLQGTIGYIIPIGGR